MIEHKQYTLRVSYGMDMWEQTIDAIDDNAAIAFVERYRADNPFYKNGAELNLFSDKKSIARWEVEVRIHRIGTIGFP